MTFLFYFTNNIKPININKYMEKYINRTSILNKNIIIRLSQFGFALFCDYSICNRIHGNFPHGADNSIECLENLKDGNRIYINMHVQNINECINTIIEILEKKQIKLNFYIMQEPIVKKEIVDRLMPYSYHMFLQNNIYDHPQIHNMPIGIRDGEEVFPEHQHFSGKLLVDEKNTEREKKYLCFMCYTNTHIERDRCEDILGNKPFVLNLIRNEYPPQPSIHCRKVPVWINYQNTHESYYTLSPSGLGQATHRFFEAIYLDSIPIVKRTNTAFDKLYNVFPCMIVEDWVDVTEELLKNSLEYYTKKMQLFKEKYPNIYTCLNNIEELLLQT